MAQLFFKNMRRFVLLAVLVVPTQSIAQTWEYISPEVSKSKLGLHGAAINNSKTFITVYYLPSKDFWLANFSIPLQHSLDTIKSRIGKTGGKEVALTLPPNKYLVKKTASNLTQISFSIANSDIEKLQASNYWILEAAGMQYRFPLTGSRAAFDQAMFAISDEALKDAELDDANHASAQAISDCDQQAGHPWDSQGNPPGRAWADIDGQTAVASCSSAMSDPNPSPRMMFQLARSYDKVGDARTFALMKEAAWEEDYAAAFNHLGIFYRDGEYTSENPDRAVKAFQRGYELGNMPSCHNLAIMRRDAANTASERATSHRILKNCADNSYLLSLVEYGKMVMDGEIDGTAQSEAQPYLERAAYAGNAEASYALASMYRDGVGVSASPSSYLLYLRMAAKQGHKTAKSELGID